MRSTLIDILIDLVVGINYFFNKGIPENFAHLIHGFVSLSLSPSVKLRFAHSTTIPYPFVFFFLFILNLNSYWNLKWSVPEILMNNIKYSSDIYILLVFFSLFGCCAFGCVKIVLYLMTSWHWEYTNAFCSVVCSRIVLIHKHCMHE